MKDSVVAEIASKAVQGDMQAFEQLYTEFSPLVYSVLLEITHDPYEAEDLTQDCFVSALKNIHTLKEPAKAKKWLTAIAANHGKDYLKKKKPALLAPEHEYIFEIQEEKNEADLPEESAVLDERSEEIREIVNSVSEDKRLCLVLFYQHEMSIAEISEELGISEAAVKSRLFRAREDVKEEVEKRSKKGMPLFGVAPLPLILFALQKSSEAASASFSGSAAQTAAFAGVTAAAQVGTTAAATSAAAAASTTAATGAGTTASAAATGIGAKIAAMSVAQKVVAGVAAASIVAGSSAGAAVVVKNRAEAKEASTTALVEEITTAPDYSSGDFTMTIPALAHTEATTQELSVSEEEISGSFLHSVTHTTAAEKEKKTTAASNTAPNKTTTRTHSTTQKPTTARTTTTKPVTAATTKAASTTKAVKATTTQPSTKPAAVTTTKAAVITTASSRATVTVTVWGEETSTTKTLYFEAGEQITADEIETRLSDEYQIEAIVDAINITAQAGGSYTATAYE